MDGRRDGGRKTDKERRASPVGDQRGVDDIVDNKKSEKLIESENKDRMKQGGKNKNKTKMSKKKSVMCK